MNTELIELLREILAEMKKQTQLLNELKKKSGYGFD